MFMKAHAAMTQSSPTAASSKPVRRIPPTLKAIAEIWNAEGKMPKTEMWVRAQKELARIVDSGDAEMYNYAMQRFFEICEGKKPKRI